MIPAFANMLSVDMEVLLVNMLYIAKLRIRKIGKFSMLLINMVLKTRFNIDRINNGSRNDHPTPKIEFLYRNLKSIMAKVRIKERNFKISFISISIIPLDLILD